jgi:hypothetical protein
MCPECADKDEDGLSDVWETTGVDTDCGGVVDLDLAAQGAKPNHRDVFLVCSVCIRSNGTSGAHVGSTPKAMAS